MSYGPRLGCRGTDQQGHGADHTKERRPARPATARGAQPTRAAHRSEDGQGDRVEGGQTAASPAGVWVLTVDELLRIHNGCDQIRIKV
jgi:hypothetical protein